jgi:hypothetical protein
MPMIGNSRSEVDGKFQPAMEMCQILIRLKNTNGDYSTVLDPLTIDKYTNLTRNGGFGDGSSPEYGLRDRRRLLIFLFPESEMARLEERKKNLKKEYE